MDREPNVRSVAVELDGDSAPAGSSFVVVEKRAEPPLPTPAATQAPEFSPAPPQGDDLPLVDAEHPAVSARSRAEAALGKGDLDAAFVLYTQWLRAEPTDANSWYNLACVESLRGEHDRALRAFETSLIVGFDLFDHARGDSDLDAIRDDPRFAEALTAAESRRSERDLPGMTRHHVVTETVGTYAVLLPENLEPGRKYPVCVILHGSGSDELSHGRVSTGLGREDVVYVLPRALQAHVGATISRGEAGWAVWPPENVADDAGILPMSLHVDWIFRCVDHAAERYPVDASKVAVWGHSQGAAAAISCAALRPDRVATICAYAGYCPDEIADKRVTEMVAANVELHLLHSQDDRVVPVDATRSFRDRVVAAGGEIDVVLYSTGGHGLHQEVRDRSQRWMRDFAHAFGSR